MASADGSGNEPPIEKITRSLRGLTFTPSPAYGLDASFNISTAYNASTALGRASFANQLRQSALRAEMPDASIANIRRIARANISEEERRVLENPVFGQATVRAPNGARATRKGNRVRTVSQRFNIPTPPPGALQPWAPPAPKRPRLNEAPEPESEPEIEFVGTNSPTEATAAPALPLPQTKRYLREGNYVVATAAAPRNGILGNHIIQKPGVIKRITHAFRPNGPSTDATRGIAEHPFEERVITKYQVQPLENMDTNRRSTTVYTENQITHVYNNTMRRPAAFAKKQADEMREDFINRIYNTRLPAIYPYYNPYYVVVSGPPGNLYELERLLPSHLRYIVPRTEKEIDNPGTYKFHKNGEEFKYTDAQKILLKFRYAWQRLIDSVSEVYGDFLRKITKIHSLKDLSPSSFSILILDSAIPPNSSPAFIYGIRELLTDPQFFVDKCKAPEVKGKPILYNCQKYDKTKYTETFIQTILNNGIYIPQRDPRTARYSIKDRIEFYLKLILYHPFTQHLNPWMSYIDSIAVVVENPSRVNTNITKYTYKVTPVKNLIDPDKKVLDHAFREAMRLALEYV